MRICTLCEEKETNAIYGPARCTECKRMLAAADSRRPYRRSARDRYFDSLAKSYMELRHIRETLFGPTGSVRFAKGKLI